MACSFSQSQNRAVGKQQVCLSSDIQVEMASRGNVETDKLKANVQEQLQRLLTQLEVTDPAETRVQRRRQSVM